VADTKHIDWRKKPRSPKFANIVADAAALGVTRMTLFRALTQRTNNNAPLLRRYADLVRLRSNPQNPKS
jgi:hypothetical protein